MAHSFCTIHLESEVPALNSQPTCLGGLGRMLVYGTPADSNQKRTRTAMRGESVDEMSPTSVFDKSGVDADNLAPVLESGTGKSLDISTSFDVGTVSPAFFHA